MNTKSNVEKTNDKQSLVDKILSIEIEAFIGIVFFIMVFFIILIQIFSREFAYVAKLLNISISFQVPIWTEEAARWCWVWIVFIMLGGLEKTDGHLKVLFLYDKLPKLVAHIVTLFLDILYIAIVILLFKLSIDHIARLGQTTPVTLPFSNLWLYISLLIGLIFVLIRVFFRIINSIKRFVGDK